jgi:hypothetical protein
MSAEPVNDRAKREDSGYVPTAAEAVATVEELLENRHSTIEKPQT